MASGITLRCRTASALSYTTSETLGTFFLERKTQSRFSNFLSRSKKNAQLSKTGSGQIHEETWCTA